MLHFFFISNHIFESSLEFAIKNPKMRFKVAMKLLSIFGIEAKVAKLLHNFSLKCIENKQKLEKLTKVAKNF